MDSIGPRDSPGPELGKPKKGEDPGRVVAELSHLQTPTPLTARGVCPVSARAHQRTERPIRLPPGSP